MVTEITRKSCGLFNTKKSFYSVFIDFFFQQNVFKLTRKKKAENKTVYRDLKKKATSPNMWQQQQLSATELLKLASFLLNVQPRAPPDTGVTA